MPAVDTPRSYRVAARNKQVRLVGDDHRHPAGGGAPSCTNKVRVTAKKPLPPVTARSSAQPRIRATTELATGPFHPPESNRLTEREEVAGQADHHGWTTTLQ